MTSFLKKYATILIPFFVYFSHALLFRDWIIDDAGISFVYARNLAEGHGLVSQPGTPPVEGYSNFLWLILLTPFFLLHIFQPIIVPKFISFILVFFSMGLVNRIVRLIENRDSSLLCGIILFLLSLNTSFVVWTTSGLENPLLIFLVLLYIYFLLFDFGKGRISSRTAFFSGLASGAISLTRPDGVLYFFAYPLVWLIFTFQGFRKISSLTLRHLIYFSLTFLTIFGGYIIFRLVYFQDVFCNPYYAKGGPALSDFLRIITFQPGKMLKLSNLFYSIGGPAKNITLFMSVALSIYLIYVKKMTTDIYVIAVFLLIAVFCYLLLPFDWMGEFRLATPFVCLVYLYGVIITRRYLESLKIDDKIYKIVSIALIISAGIGSIYLFTGRSLAFAKTPTAPFARVGKKFGIRYNEYAERLAIRNGSFLLPDVGGALYYSKLKIYDLGQLCDKTIARTLGRDPGGFYDYVFEDTRPTFIHTYGSWSCLARFEKDPRFRRDYLPILERQEICPNGEKTVAGDYVRREVAEQNPLGFQAIRMDYGDHF